MRWLLLGVRRLYLLDEPSTERGRKVVDLDVPMRIKKLKKKQCTLVAGNNTFYITDEELAGTKAFETERDMVWALAAMAAQPASRKTEDDVVNLDDLE